MMIQKRISRSAAAEKERPGEDLYKGALCAENDGRSGGAPERRIYFAQGYCPAAGGLQEISGADRADPEQVRLSEDKSRLSGRLYAVKAAPAVHRRRHPAPDGGGPCARSVRGAGPGRLSPQRGLRHAAGLARAEPRHQRIPRWYHAAGPARPAAGALCQ